MSDYSEEGALPVEDAAVADPPTEEEVRAEQELRYPEQAKTALHGVPDVDHDRSSTTASASPPDGE